MISNVDVIFKYVLLNIYTRRWQQGERIPSKKSFAIKFNCTVAEVMKALNKLKQNGFVDSVERFGYYVSQNPHSYFFYSVSDFYDAKRIETTIFKRFKVPLALGRVINAEARDFRSFIDADLCAFKRDYYYSHDKTKASKVAYFLFKSKVFSAFQDLNTITTKPLYEFLALNGLIVTRNDRVAFFSGCPVAESLAPTRCWVVVEFVYDISNLPVAILFINYFDHRNRSILYKRSNGIYK